MSSAAEANSCALSSSTAGSTSELSPSARDPSSHGYSVASAMPITRRGSRNCSKGDKDNCEAEGSDVDRSYRSVPLGKAKGENISARRQDQ